MKKIRYALLLILLITLSATAQQPVQFLPEAAELYQNGMNAMRLRRLTVAREQFQELADKFPEDVHASLARRQLVSILRDLKEYETAISMLQKIMKEDISEDNREFAREELLDLLYELQRFKQGVELLEELRREKPEDFMINRQLAKFYLQTGRKDEAWLLLESMMERPGAAEAFKDLLELAVKSGEIEKLLQALEARQSRYRSHDFADFSADCYIALGRKDKAIEVLKSVENLKDHLILQRKLADLLIDTGDYEEAFNTLSLGLHIVPGDWSIIKKMGHCRFMQKRTEEAIEVWRRPLSLPFMQRRDFYQDLTTVLIEHQMNDEALKTFYEARKAMNQQTMFSEEVATILEAMGRKNEAIEEYIQVFSEGIFRPEVFERLYKAFLDGFALEKRLKEMLEGSRQNYAIMQALLELHFRKADKGKIKEVIDIVSNAVGALDEVFYERINQEALLSPADFHFEVAEAMIEARQSSTLALRLSMLLLEMGTLDERWEKEAYLLAGKTASAEAVADADLKAQLLLELADFSFERLHDIKAAAGYLEGILQTDLNRAVPERSLMAAIMQARLFTVSEKFSQSVEILDQTEKKLTSGEDDIFNPDPVSESETLAAIVLERAYMQVHSGEYQKALEELKKLVETMTESEWANDALELANFIMRRSIADFSLIKKTLKAERLKYQKKYSESVSLLEETIRENASATSLITEIQAEIIMLKSNYLESSEVISEIDQFSAANEGHFKVADLWELKWKLMKQQKRSSAEINEHLQTFIDHFPSDLRSGRFRKKIASLPAEAVKGVEGEKDEK